MAKKKTQKAKGRPAQRGVKKKPLGKINIEAGHEDANWLAKLRLPDGRELIWLEQPDAPGGALAHLVTPGGLVALPELGNPDSLQNLQQIVATLMAAGRET